MRKHYRLLIITGLTLANAIVSGGAGYSLYQSHQQYEGRARSLTQNIALAVEENVSTLVAKIDLVLATTVEELEHQLATGGIDENRANTFLARQTDRLPELEAIRVAAADGAVILGKGLNKAERPSWADRDYFLQLRNHPDPPLIMSPPRTGRVAKRVIIGFQRRYNGPDGRFAGVIAAPVAIEHFERLISRFDLGPQGGIALRDGNLGLITRHPPLAGTPAGTLGDTTVSTELQALVDSGMTAATYHTDNAPDRLERITSFRRARTVPVYVLASTSSRDYLADWHKELYATGSLVAGFLLLSLLSGLFLIKLIGRLFTELEDRRNLQAAERRRRSSHQRLNEIAASVHLPLNEQLHKALAIGAEHLQLELGIVSHVENDIYTIVAQCSPPGTLHDGQSFPFGVTYCNVTLASKTVVAIANWGKAEVRDHPCYQTFKLEAYIGAPLQVDGQVFGTVNFSSPHPYHREFDDGDREFIGLLARWTGSVIERDRAQQQLATSELRLKTIVETEPECVKIVAVDGTLLQMNRAGLDMVEADAEEDVVGAPVVDLIAPLYRAAFLAMHERVCRGAADALEFEIVGLKGGRRWLDTHAVPMRDAAGRIDGQLAVTRDITEHKRNEIALQAAQQAAEAANIAKSQFLATMSHEIRTPMNGILGMAQLLLMPNLDDQERQDYARVIINSGQILLTLLNDILDLSKIEAGRVELENLVFAPAQLIKEISTLFSEQAQAKHLKLVTTWHGSHDAGYRSDPARLRQMLSNLVSNAIKFTAEGSICIECREEALAADTALLEFSVTDSGIGIPEDKQALLFMPFSQIDASTTRKYGGTGLGLSIVRNMAQLMKGEVGISSQEGVGSRFWFRVRADRLKAGEERRLGERVASVLEAPPPKLANRSYHALIVEDNLSNRKVLEAILKKQGVRYSSVENGHEAVKLVTAGVRPDLILMDCQMPVMDGFAATTAIRQWEQETGRPRLPIVALTAGVFEEDRLHCISVGMDDFLTKPINIDELQSALEKWSNPRAAE